MAAAVSFGYKMGWLAARSSTPEEVIEALNIEEATASSWEEGIERTYSSSSMTEHQVFVTPQLSGWVLAASPAYFDETSDTDPQRLVRFVVEAAQRLDTEVQLFVTHRVVEGHAWARAAPDSPPRAYYYLGEADECLLDVGARTPFEETLACLSPDASEPADESTVMSVAEAWSLDPTALDVRFPEVADGFLGLIRVPTHEALEEPARPQKSRPWWKVW